MIYLVKAEGTNLYKIGYTGGKAKSRVKAMQTGCPYRLSIIKEVEGSQCREKLLHEAFLGKRKQGEWFELDDKTLREVSVYMTKIQDSEWEETEVENCQQKSISLSFRTSKQNIQYLRLLAESDDRSLSYAINKMVDSFRSKKVKDIRKVK